MAVAGVQKAHRLLAQLLPAVAGAQSLRSFASLPAEEVEGLDRKLENHAAVLYGMRAVGVCQSDIHYYKKGRIGKNVVKEKMVLGHESAGDVVALGSNVTSLAVGDRVALEPGVPCWGNLLPRMGRYNLCPDIKFFATPPVHGSLARFVDHPGDFCFRLPDNVTYEGGAMCEPLSNGINACRRGKVEPGKKVAIIGAGPMGLNALVAARGYGASKVAVTDVRSDNLPIAKQLGVDVALLTPRDMTPEDIAAALRAELPPFGPDVVIDCAGFDSTLQAAMESVASGGKVVIVGMGQPVCSLNTDAAIVKELDIHGSYRYTNTYPLCLEWLSSGRIDLGPLITHRFPFNEQSVLDGFECAAAVDHTKCIKAMFELPPDDL